MRCRSRTSGRPTASEAVAGEANSCPRRDVAKAARRGLARSAKNSTIGLRRRKPLPAANRGISSACGAISSRMRRPCAGRRLRGPNRSRRSPPWGCARPKDGFHCHATSDHRRKRLCLHFCFQPSRLPTWSPKNTLPSSGGAMRSIAFRRMIQLPPSSAPSGTSFETGFARLVRTRWCLVVTNGLQFPSKNFLSLPGFVRFQELIVRRKEKKLIPRPPPKRKPTSFFSTAFITPAISVSQARYGYSGPLACRTHVEQASGIRKGFLIGG